MAILIMHLSWRIFMDSYVSNEQSSNSGGLLRWPAFGGGQLLSHLVHQRPHNIRDYPI